MKAFRPLLPLAALAAGLFLSTPAFAAPVDADGAKELVQGYRNYMDGQLLGGAMPDGVPEPVALTADIDGTEATVAWVFEFEGGGWMVVSADDTMDPVPAFSHEGEVGDAFTNEASPARFFLLAKLVAQYRAANGLAVPAAAPAARALAAATGDEPVNEETYEALAAADEEAAYAFAQEVQPAQANRWALFREAAKEGDTPAPKALGTLADMRVPELMETKWSQSGHGENYYVPKSSAGYVPCGCTQTAMGQAIFFHKWPQAAPGQFENYRGSIYAYENGQRGSTVLASSSSVSWNDGSTTHTTDTNWITGGGDRQGGAYQWDKMYVNSTKTPYGKYDQAALGALLVDIGIINGASYKSGGTGANNYPAALMKAFQFENIRSTKIANTHATTFSGTGASQLTNAVMCNLDAKQPCPIAGWTSSSGHATVMDGYGFQDGQAYFHVNFGWGGSSDGYYTWDNWGGYSTSFVYFNMFPQGTGEIISGRTLTPDGRPIANLTVTCTLADGSTKTTKSDSRGIWAITRVPSSTTVSVTASATTDYTFGSQSVTVGKSSQTGCQPYTQDCGNVWGVELRAIPRGAMVWGTVKNPEGSPIPGVRVVSGDGRYSATTDSLGVYSFATAVGWSGIVKLADGQGQLGCEPASYTIPALSAGTALERNFVTAVVLFVDCDATDGANDGTSWADAFTDLQSALGKRKPGAEIWVAEGVYKPTTGTARDIPFLMVTNVAVFGGFSGVETARSQRNWVAHRTILSGDIGVAGTKTDNSAMLVVGAPGATLDGFTITDAYQNTYLSSISSALYKYGEGVISSKTGVENSDFNFLVEHCLVTGNTCYGELLYGFGNYRSCVVAGNTTLSSYGALSYGNQLVNCTFADNTNFRQFCNSGSYSTGNYPPARFQNCYFKQTLSSTDSYYGQYYYAYPSNTDPSTLFGDHNLHRTADKLSITNSTMISGAALQRADETLAGPPAAPYMPPSASMAKDKGASQAWAANATDYLGNPRVNGTIDIGAYEITSFSAPFIALGVGDVSYHTASATLSVISLGGTATSGSAVLKYGTSANLSGAESVSASVGIGEKTFSLSGLLAGTTYYVQVTVTGSGTTSSQILSFTTKPMTAPDVAIGAIGEPTGSSVTVDWSLSSIGKGVTKATIYVDYSTSSTFASAQSVTAKTDATGAASGTVTLTGLSAGTTYYLRVRGVNDAPLTGYSATKSVTTVDAAAPDFSFSVAPSETVTRGVVTLNVTKFGTGASSGTATIEYATSSDFSDAKTATAAVSSTGATAVELTRLSAGTLYYVRVTLANNNGKSLSRAAQTFTTGDPGFVAPGLKQVRYSCSGSSYPDFTVTVATASDFSTYAVERAPGPFMADITGTSCSAVNEYTGTTWAWANNTTYYYEGEMFFKGGVTYNFFHCIDDGAAIELDGEWLTRMSAGNVSGYNAGVQKASKTYAADGWHAIRIWVYDWSGGKGYVSGKIGFSGIGIGWNTNGCTTVNAANEANWSTLRDPGDASLLRVLSSDSMPSFVELNDDLMIAGTTLTGSLHTDGVEDGCTITLYAGHENAGSNTVGWTQTFVAGTVPSEGYDLSFQWDEFCDGSDLTGWYVIARMTNPSGTYEGWSVVREPSAGNVFFVAIKEGESTLTSVSATPRVAGFGDGAQSATVCLQYSTDASFASAQSTATVTATSTNWLSAVTISGLTPNTLYYVRTKGVKGSETVYSRAAQLSTKDYGTPAGTISASTTTLTTIPISWSVTGLGLGNTSAEVWLDYGTSSSYGTSVKLDTVTGAKSGTYTLENLPGETTYYFRLRIVASPSGKTFVSSGASAQTKPVGNPVVSATLGAVAQYTATFSYNLTALGEGAVSAALYYDVATSSDFSGAKSTSIASGVTSVPKVGTATATGLSAETTYYLRVRAVNHAGKVGTSATMTFTTTAVGDPEVAVDMTGVLQRAATASISIATLGEAAKSATVTLEYGTSTSYGKTVTVSGTPAAGAVLSALIEGLEPETTYYVRVTVKNDANKTGVATTSFKTLEPNDPVFTHTVTPSYTAGSFMLDVTKIGNGATSASGYVRWGTSASALTSGPAALSKIVEPGTMSGAATGLSNSTTYYYEIVVTNNLTGMATATGSFTTKSPGNLNWGEGYYQGGLLQGYNKGNGQQWGLDVSKSSAQAARWNSSGYVASFAYGAVASYQVKSTSNWTNPYDGATYPMDSYNRMWAYGGQMWMEKGVKYYFAVNFFYAASISVDGEVVCSEENGGNGTPQVGSVTPTTTGWHDIAIAVGSNGNGAGAANNPWNSGSPFTSLRYGTAWNTNGLSSVTSANASQWKQLLDAGDRHLFRARGKLGEMAFLDQPATWTSSSLTVPVRLDSSMDGLTLKLYASRSPDAWYFEDRWEKTVTVGSVGEGAAIKSGTFTGIQVEAGVDWYVSARLYNAAGTYDQWTDPVKFTPQIVKQPPAGAVTVGTPDFTSNTATVSVTSLGDETGTVAVVLEYATDQAFTEPVSKTGTAVSAPGSQDFSLTGLLPGRTYYVRARLTGSALHLETVTDVVSFTTPSYTPPVIASVVATPGATSASIAVNVSALGQGSDSATVQVFVSTGAFGSTPDASGTITATGTSTYSIAGLQAGTAYFVKVVVTGSNGLSATNTDESFVTGSQNPPAGTLAIVSVTANSASATVGLTALGDNATKVSIVVEYATDAAFSSKKTVSGTDASAAGTQVLALTGLAGETKYYARAVFTGSPSGLVGYSETVEFTTLGAMPPAGSLEISGIGFDAATATLAVTSFGDDATSVAATLEIADNEAFTGATTVATPTYSKTISADFALSGLSAGKTYWVRATLVGKPSNRSAVLVKSFSTTAYGAPVIGSVTDTKDFQSATLSVPIVDLGAGSDSVVLSVCVDVEYGCTGGETKAASLDAPGTATLSWSDLQPGTKYYWYVKATGSNGQVAEARGDFTTPLYPLVIGEASAVAGDNGLSATMRVSLLNLASPPATVKLYLDGTLVRTWSDVTEAGDFEHTATTEPNKKYSFYFEATAGGETVRASGSFQTVAAEDWFNVRWGEDGYATGASWNVAAAVSKSGGSWTRPADDESEFDGARLRLVPPEDSVAVLRFTPSKAVKTGADVTVEGSTVVAVGGSNVEAPSGTRGGLVFLEDGPMGWTRDGWIALKGAAPEAGDTVSWKMEVALSGENAPAIRYTVDGAVLADADGREWFALSSGVSTVGAVGFAGGGSLGDFRGYYKAQIVGKFEKPNFGAATPDGDALGFGVDASGKPTFSVSIDNASDAAVYGVYVCATVDGDYVRDKGAVVSGSGEFKTFTVSADNANTKFVVIVAAEEESQLVDHLDDIEGLE